VRALGWRGGGTLAGGQRADLVVWRAKLPAELCYWIGGQLVREVYVGGELLAE
jgi:imidazolonepropionase